ncbi:MAG: carbohydrate kinase family protein [Candidatus Peribacteria bacterium]|nr:MAG: carbohydrate kinase family protein [Candidatus Peribacteria bacterium]
MALLSEDAILLTSVGEDFRFDPFLKEKINLEYVVRDHDKLSASAYIVTDSHESQITSFYPGAMDIADSIYISDVRQEISYAIVSPNKKEAMAQHIDELHKMGVKTFFDPGQQLFAFTKYELEDLGNKANYLIVNEYEYHEFLNRTGKTETELKSMFEKIVVTLGEKGSKIMDKGQTIEVPACKVEEVVDPTGAGDAFRAGMLRGLHLGYSWEIAAKIGSVMASYCVQFSG